MPHFFWPVLVGFCFFSAFSRADESILVFKDTWQIDYVFGGKLFAAIVDPDGYLIGQFQKDRPFIANKDGMRFLRPLGRGPGDLESCFGACFRDGDLVIAEHYGKIKIFHKEDGEYQWKASVTRPPEGSHHFVNDLAYYQGKWFIGGFSTYSTTKGLEANHVRVYDEEGKFLTSLVNLPVENRMKSYQLMDYHLRQKGSRLYFLRDEALVVYVIDAAKPALTQTVELQRPRFYKEIPDETYVDKKRRGLSGFEERLVNWRLSYSSIVNVAVTDQTLVLQLRTLNPRMKRFALLFYDLDDFELKTTYEIDDLLITNDGDRFYFFRGGVPGIDDDAGEFIVDIYQIGRGL